MDENEQLRAEAQKANIDVIKEIGFFGYRSLITLNSGAFVVILTFVANASENGEFELDSFWLKLSMCAFLLGLTLTFISAAIAYVQAQLNLSGLALPMGSSVRGHMFWLLTPVIFAFLAFMIGGACAISGIVPK